MVNMTLYPADKGIFFQDGSRLQLFWDFFLQFLSKIFCPGCTLIFCYRFPFHSSLILRVKQLESSNIYQHSPMIFQESRPTLVAYHYHTI